MANLEKNVCSRTHAKPKPLKLASFFSSRVETRLVLIVPPLKLAS